MYRKGTDRKTRSLKPGAARSNYFLREAETEARNQFWFFLEAATQGKLEILSEAEAGNEIDGSSSFSLTLDLLTIYLIETAEDLPKFNTLRNSSGLLSNEVTLIQDFIKRV